MTIIGKCILLENGKILVWGQDIHVWTDKLSGDNFMHIVLKMTTVVLKDILNFYKVDFHSSPIFFF